MKDFDIKIKGNCEARIFGTGDETMVLPSNAKIDTARDKGDITTDAKEVKIGLPSCSEKVEIAAEASDITIESLEFETLEIDAKEKITIRLIDTEGKTCGILRGGTDLRVEALILGKGVEVLEVHVEPQVLDTPLLEESFRESITKGDVL